MKKNFLVLLSFISIFLIQLTSNAGYVFGSPILLSSGPSIEYDLSAQVRDGGTIGWHIGVFDLDQPNDAKDYQDLTPSVGNWPTDYAYKFKILYSYSSGQLSVAVDKNEDGVFTGSDPDEMASWIFNTPGNYYALKGFRYLNLLIGDPCINNSLHTEITNLKINNQAFGSFSSFATENYVEEPWSNSVGSGYRRWANYFFDFQGYSEDILITGEYILHDITYDGNYLAPGFEIKFGQPGTPTSVPEPTTMLLLGFGLVSLAGIRKKLEK
jgi:hypothetical protein